MNYKKIKVGNRLKILSCPRSGDGADGFAGTIGTVDEINYDERFEHHLIGYIYMTMENGGIFCGVGLNRLDFEILT